ncbi:2'-5' RNA ligase family protein [Rufibacter glacialis]|uniref:2'-5' RNA ligase family protein n=1 Tax=Rufibacter glacialis TaxID=1259555 RepID=A0A5M8QE63_9BACT|nr:2'-5' RNA ligase family protein [Rufibacter glacialis]KAA6434335.1 2'-5' RNA ligase family protein [Rufibacter glacialis]GGK68641.1 hypothetical protein GCM10011405_15950 [Rufibacter glacialis]
MEEKPLIVALTLNQEAFDFFTALRTQHFPPDRNYLSAHLTLFHHLPPNQPEILEHLSLICQKQATIPLQVTGLMRLGQGVAYQVAGEQLQQLHLALQKEWEPFLTPQDRQKLRPHITVQNKVTPAQAQELERQLTATFSPFAITGTGLTVWEYAGGPWDFYRQFDFQP